MNGEKIAVVVDSGSSIRQDDEAVIRRNIEVLPLEVIFNEDGKSIPYKDTELTPTDFYFMLGRAVKIPPTTNGSVIGSAQALYESLALNGKSEIISIHITSRHSAAYDSAVTAARITQENYPDLKIEVIDSKSISAGTGFLADKAVEMVKRGTKFEDIVETLRNDANKIELFAVLNTLKYVAMGGRIPNITATMADFLQVKPLLRIVDGSITQINTRRTMAKAEVEIVEEVEAVCGRIAKIAVLHTNNLEWAKILRSDLDRAWSGDIPIYEAGPALAVHAGPGAIGVALLKE